MAIENALASECDCFQIFSHSPRSWQLCPLNEEEVLRFRRLRRKAGLKPVVIHTPYLLNLCSDDPTLRMRSRRHLLAEMVRAHELGADLVNTHVGSARSKKRERERLERGIPWVLHRAPGKVKLVFENGAGPKSCLGSNLVELCRIIRGCDSRVGLCIDVAHAFQAGYDLRNLEGVERMVETVREEGGLKRLKLLHLNDSKTPFGSGRDRHSQIGMGEIGLEGFRAICRHPCLANVPGILETPKENSDDDLRNIRRLRSLCR